MGDMNNFRNFNANLETFNVDSKVKVKVTGVKNWMCLERSCPRACVCKISKCTLIGIGDMNNFRNFNTDLETLTLTLRSRSRSIG